MAIVGGALLVGLGVFLISNGAGLIIAGVAAVVAAFKLKNS